MTRDKLIEISKEVFNDNGYFISTESESETADIYVKKWSKKLNNYGVIFKLFTYAGKLTGWKSGDNIIWYIHFSINGDTKSFLIPDEESGFRGESIAKDFIKLFRLRIDEYLIISKEYESKLDNLIKLKNLEDIQSIIRDFKLNEIGIKSENQE